MNDEIELTDLIPIPGQSGFIVVGYNTNGEIVRFTLNTVSFSGNYSDLSGLPTLGSSSSRNIGTGLAEVPLNSGLSEVSRSGSYTDLNDQPDLGTAASRDVGSGPNNLVENSALGTAAYLNAGTGPNDVPQNNDLPDNIAGLSSAGATNWDSGTLLNEAPIPVTVNNSGSYTLPAGGVWDYSIDQYDTNGALTGSAVAGRANGGDNVVNRPATSFLRGWIKKVSN